jgi:hypothetical protein
VEKMRGYELSENEVLDNIDFDLSYKIPKAIEMMKEESMYGESDIGRLMQAQQFKGGKFFDHKDSIERKRLNTWRQHYIDSEKVMKQRQVNGHPDYEKDSDCECPFLVVHVRKKAVIIYKRRHVIEDQTKKKYYQTHPGVKEAQKLRNRKTKKLQIIRDSRRKLVAQVSKD